MVLMTIRLAPLLVIQAVILLMRLVVIFLAPMVVILLMMLVVIFPAPLVVIYATAWEGSAAELSRDQIAP